ncbi:MAG: hypothetical protein CSA05_02270 [Bacteroidia bacterium]|nr:MAG: hypothetical protein CSA05_02270 [Bacteroidia bacterium]
MNMQKQDISVIILAAGFSSRMKKPKAFLKFEGNKCFLEKIVKEYEKANLRQIVVVFNPKTLKYYQNHAYTFLDLHESVVNTQPHLERFFSIQKGLSAVESTNFCFIQDCDNPLIDAETIAKLMANKHKADVIAPIFEHKKGHPILISKKVIEKILEQKSPDTNLRDIIRQFEKFYTIVETDSVLKNINTQSDYARYFAS